MRDLELEAPARGRGPPPGCALRFAHGVLFARAGATSTSCQPSCAYRLYGGAEVARLAVGPGGLDVGCSGGHASGIGP